VSKTCLKPAFRAILTAVCVALGVFSSARLSAGEEYDSSPYSEPAITVLEPERAEGRGYRLEYTVNAPLDVTWRFKTDFDSKIVLTNKMILSHRLISRSGDAVITETVQSNKPKSVFRWKTLLYPDQHRLEFVLLDPDECGMDYFYGSILMQAVGASTRVTQVAYLDFFGVSLWVHYPFRGGMLQTLNDNVHWEQKAVLSYWRDGQLGSE